MQFVYFGELFFGFASNMFSIFARKVEGTTARFQGDEVLLAVSVSKSEGWLFLKYGWYECAVLREF